MKTDDEARIAAVHALNILDTEPEPVFEDAVALAAAFCGVPISLITLLDGKRQWFKAKVGIDVCETPQEHAFCAHALHRRDLFLVSDATKDSRFVDNPLVTGSPHIRFYAGMPLTTPEGYALGTLCVIDIVPRVLTAEQKRALGLLGAQVYRQMKMRNLNISLRQRLADQRAQL